MKQGSHLLLFGEVYYYRENVVRQPHRRHLRCGCRVRGDQVPSRNLLVDLGNWNLFGKMRFRGRPIDLSRICRIAAAIATPR